MANTLKFGAGEWATKKGSTLAYNSENGNFKPLPFTFDRSTSATRVNKEGLIEVVSNNEPRIDFLNDSKGALLLEPSRSNLLTYSEDFSDASWTKTRVTVTQNNVVSPDGALNADKITETSDNGLHAIYANTTVTSGVSYTFSVLIKKGSSNFIQFCFGTNNVIGNPYVNFDVNQGIYQNNGVTSANIENYGNGWYRCSATYVTATTSFTNYICQIQSISDSRASSFTGNVNNNIYIYGAQLEQGSYATSYIPTQGSIGTRVAESCEQTPPSGIINSSEGVLYLDLKTSENDTVQQIALTDGTIDERILLEIRNGGTLLTYYVIQGGVAEAIIAIPISAGVYNKVALSYKTNEAKIYVNGVLEGTDVVVTPPTGLDTISFNGSTGSLNVYISLKDLRVYNQVLTDAELQALTS